MNPSLDPHHHDLIRTLRTMRFLGSFVFGAVATVRILQLEAVGLSPAQIGGLMAGYSVLIAVIEIPSGALADVWGRRNTKVLSLLVLIASLGAFALSDGFAVAAVALVLLAVGRALGSGPTESWFVDEIGEPHHPAVLAGISTAEAAHNVGVALGAVVGGLVPWLIAGRVEEAQVFAPVFTLAAAALVVDALVTGRGMIETTALPTADVTGVWRTTVSGVGATLNARVPRWVALAFLTYGALNACIELITPQRFSADLGSDDAALAFGVLVAAAWLVSAFTATRTGRLEARAGSAGRAAGLATVLLVVSALPAVIGQWFGPGLSYIGLNTVGGPLLPLLATIIHRHVSSAHRSTALSTLNLAFMAGAAIGSAMVAVIDTGAVLAVAAVTLLCGWGLLRAEQAASRERTAVHDAEPAVDPVAEPPERAAAEPKADDPSSVPRALRRDFAAATGTQWVLLLAAVAWLVYEWGPGNETVTPWILTNLLKDNEGFRSVALLMGVGFAFTALQQSLSGLTAVAALSTFRRTAARVWSNVESAGVEGLGLTRPWAQRSLRERVFIGFALGSTAVAVGEVMLAGSSLDRRSANRAVVSSACYTGAAVAVLAGVVAFLTWLGRSFQRSAETTESIIDFLSAPWPWLVLAVIVLARWVLEVRSSSST
jgi:MFS family permease